MSVGKFQGLYHILVHCGAAIAKLEFLTPSLVVWHKELELMKKVDNASLHTERWAVRWRP